MTDHGEEPQDERLSGPSEHLEGEDVLMDLAIERVMKDHGERTHDGITGHLYGPAGSEPIWREDPIEAARQRPDFGLVMGAAVAEAARRAKVAQAEAENLRQGVKDFIRADGLVHGS